MGFEFEEELRSEEWIGREMEGGGMEEELMIYRAVRCEAQCESARWRGRGLPVRMLCRRRASTIGCDTLSKGSKVARGVLSILWRKLSGMR